MRATARSCSIELGHQETNCQSRRNRPHHGCCGRQKKVKKTKHKTGWGYMTQKVSFFDAKGQELACAVLCILAHGCHTDNQEKIIQVGAIEWVLTAMKAYLTKKMQEMTCDLLKNVFARIGSVKAIDTIVQGLDQHRDNAQVQEAGCEALSSLDRNVNDRVKIAEMGGIEAILKDVCTGAGMRQSLSLPFMQAAAHSQPLTRVILYSVKVLW